MKKMLFIIALLFFISCKKKDNQNAKQRLNYIAEKYVRLGLIIGQYDPDFVDAYYGPDSLKPILPKKAKFPKDSLLKSVSNLISSLGEFTTAEASDTLLIRAHWLNNHLIAFERRIKIFSGEPSTFDVESKDLFGVTAPVKTEPYFKSLVSKLDSLLPGKGDLSLRLHNLAAKFVIPSDKMDTVFKAAIAESRKNTKKYLHLPKNETFTLEFVTNKPWGGYNWYKGNYKSVIQINTDLPIYIDRAIDVSAHEGYPGHHVRNVLTEKNLYNDKGWVEASLSPLFCPRSLVDEGSANYGIKVAFPGNEEIKFAKEVLLPLAGLDTAGIGVYFKTLTIRNELNYVRNEVARGMINGTMTEKEALRWLMDYNLSSKEGAMKSLSFIKKYRSYVINYNYGQDLVKNYIESNGGTDSSPAKRWGLFGNLVSNELMPVDILKATRK